MIFTKQGDLMLQNYLANWLIPKEVDYVNKKYLKKARTVNELSIVEMDKFRESLERVAKSDEVLSFLVTTPGHPFPFKCVMQNQVYNRKVCVMVSFIEQGSDKE